MLKTQNACGIQVLLLGGCRALFQPFRYCNDVFEPRRDMTCVTPVLQALHCYSVAAFTGGVGGVSETMDAELDDTGQVLLLLALSICMLCDT